MKNQSNAKPVNPTLGKDELAPDVVDCAYSVCGSGPPLILIHGIGGSQQMWNSLIAVLSRHFTVITYDLRGHGQSPKTQGLFGLEQLVNDLERVRQLTGFEQAHFAGHSLGGMIGPAYARKYPDKVLSVGLLSTAAGRTLQDSKNVWNVICDMEHLGVAEVLPTLTNRWFTDRFIAEHQQIVEARLQQVLDTPEDIFLNVFKIYATTEMLPWLGEIRAPALVLTGENDAGCSPRLNELIADTLKDSKLVVLPDYKHSILLEAGEQVAQHIVEFISALQLPEAAEN